MNGDCPHYGRSRRWGLPPSLAVIIILSVAAATAAELDSKINKIEQDILRSNSEFLSITDEIDKLSSQIDELDEKKQTTAIKIDMLTANIQGLTSKINKLNADYQARGDNLNSLIAELEQTGALGRKSRIFADENAAVIKKLCVSDNGGEILLMHDFEEGSKARIKSFLLGDLVVKVTAFARSCSVKQRKLASEKQTVEKKIEELEVALGEFTAKVASSKKIQSSYKQSLDKIRQQQTELGKELEEKEKSKKEIDRLLETFMREKKDLLIEKEREREMEALRGTMPWPVEGAIISPFGKQKHPILDTYIVNRGIKIEASTECVRSVRDGEVSFAGYFKGYGKTVIIEHGGGFYTVTSGFSEIDVKKGDSVKTSSAIGSVLRGETMYFEIRLGGTPDDPGLWLLKNY